MSEPVTDALPPAAVLGLMNPLMRLVLSTPLGGPIGALALLEFTGRRSGRAYRVPVFLRELDGRAFVITPAPWRANFVHGAPVLVHHRGRARPMVGTLDPDAEVAARAVRTLLANGVPDRQIGIRVSEGHRVTVDDMERLGRRILRLDEPAKVPAPR